MEQAVNGLQFPSRRPVSASRTLYGGLGLRVGEMTDIAQMSCASDSALCRKVRASDILESSVNRPRFHVSGSKVLPAARYISLLS